MFGATAVCRYLHLKSKSDSTVQKVAFPEVENAFLGGQVPPLSNKCPLTMWDIYQFSANCRELNFTGIPSEVTPIFRKYGEWRDGRSAQKILTQAFRDAIARAFPECYKENQTPVEVRFDGRKFAGSVIDYSFSGSQQLMNTFKTHPSFDVKSPQEMAQRIVSYLDIDRLKWIIKKIDLAGFYINLSVAPEFLQEKINMLSVAVPGKDRFPAPPMLKPSRIVVDFSSPNIAKEMHVGHLRSTIIGDSLCRFFEHAGHEVLRVNHVGDWGTQFGMLVEYLRVREEKTGQDTLEYLNGLTLTQLTELYRQSKVEFDADGTPAHPGDPDFKNRARKMVVTLQSGKDARARKVWEKLVEVSKRGFDQVYKVLNISFENKTNLPGTGYCGESFYQDKIDDAIKALGKLVEKRGDALLLFTGLPEAKQQPSPDHPDGEIPLFLRKSDGGFGYDSTDIGAVKFRIDVLKANRVLYVTDAGQQTHFHMVFEAARKAGWTANTKLDHVKFGVVTAKGGGKFKTRSGETVTLMSLLESAQTKMYEILRARMQQEKSTTGNFDEQTAQQLSWAIGTAAVKYFDLRNNRTKDYEFDEEAMCSPDGDTAVYLMYAYARVCSIIDKANEALINDVVGYVAEGASDRERAVAVMLSRFSEIIETSMASLSPHHLCGYLYSLAADLSTFLTDDNERVWAKRAVDSNEPLKLEPARGKYRLFLVRAVREVLYEGLGLLGIVPYERM